MVNQTGNPATGLLVVIALVITHLAFADDDAKLREGWTDASRSMQDEAMAAFKAIPANSPETREASYGQAVVLLNSQPMTRGNISKAAELFQGVIDAAPSDDLGVSAKYFLGRIEQVFRFEPDRAKAVAIYGELFHSYPDRPLAQRAFVKLVLLQLYDQVSDAERAKRFAGFEVEGVALRDHDAVRDFHLLMAEACDRFGFGEAKRLDHLLAADAAGVVKPDTKANLLVSIAEIARKLGRKDLALQYYHRFLNECLRDQRSFTVEQKIAALEQAPK